MAAQAGATAGERLLFRASGAPLSCDIGFLVCGVVLIGAGWLVHLRGVRDLEHRAT